eukprot:2918362-Rhodomonas_salina.1
MIENSSRRELSPKSIQHDNATLAATVSAWRDAGGVQPHEPRVGFHAYGGGVRAPGAHHHSSDGTPQGRAARHGHPALRHGEGCNLTQLLETFNPDKLPISCQKEYENRVNNGTLEASPKRIQREETNIPVNEKDLVGASSKRIQHDAATLAAIEFARRDDGCDLTHLLETFNPDALPISCKNFHEIKVNDKDILGAGFWRKAVSGSWKGQKVAVKYVVRKDPCSKEKRDGCKMGPNMEAAVHAYLQRTSGSFLPILGKCGSTLVFPKMTPLDPEKDFPLSTRTALRYSLEIAQALAHLHDSPDGPLSYNDLQVDHLLLDGNGKIRLFDFHWLKYNGMPRRRAGGVGDNKRCGHNGWFLMANVAFYRERALDACCSLLWCALQAPPTLRI